MVLVEKQADNLFYGEVSCILLLLVEVVVLVDTINYSGIFLNESVEKDVIWELVLLLVVLSYVMLVVSLCWSRALKVERNLFFACDF